tara:strand:+ start:4676 stop:4969 length:294 start_codon:yes stop_codon:yes gene_type:complete
MGNTLNSLTERFINLGYEVNYRDKNRYVELKKMFGNDKTKVDGGDELQIGRMIEICEGEVIAKAYMKRGWLWSGSAVTAQRKGNVYAIGTERLVATY